MLHGVAAAVAGARDPAHAPLLLLKLTQHLMMMITTQLGMEANHPATVMR
jgi:hypothetical protein